MYKLLAKLVYIFECKKKKHQYKNLVKGKKSYNIVTILFSCRNVGKVKFIVKFRVGKKAYKI